MTAHSPVLHSPNAHPERPKGILKNSSSYHSNSATSPTRETAPQATSPISERPGIDRGLSEKEIVLENTLRNAGDRRRSSSNARGPGSRRQSGVDHHMDENNPQLKWDEANLYLNEQNRDSTMKIDEPKTPYAKQYDPTEDEEEIEMLNAEDLKVDELDAKPRRSKTEEIPDFDLGEPELRANDAPTPESEKRVMVDKDVDEDDGYHGELLPNATQEEKEKHRKFEQMRKKHYEMRNVKDLLGHPEDEDDDDDERAQPPVPRVPNGQ